MAHMGFRPLYRVLPPSPQYPKEALSISDSVKKLCLGSHSSLKPNISLNSGLAWESRPQTLRAGVHLCLPLQPHLQGSVGLSRDRTQGPGCGSTRARLQLRDRQRGPFYSPQDFISGQKSQSLQQTTDRCPCPLCSALPWPPREWGA